jgi:protease I
LKRFLETGTTKGPSMFKYDRLLAAATALFLLGTAHAKPLDRAVLEPNAAQEATAPVPHAELMWFLLQPVEDANQLRGYRIAILAADGVDGFDLEVPRQLLSERGATVHVVVPRPLNVRQATGSGAVVKPKTLIEVINPSGEEQTATFDRFVDQVQAADYDVVYVPGHAEHSDALAERRSIAFLQEAARAGKSIFAIGNSPLVLLEAGLLDERRATGDPATLLRLAASSATATDSPLVNDGPIYTSRNAFDMPLLMDSLIAALLSQPVR